MISKYVVTVVVDEENVYDKYPNYRYNYRDSSELADSEGGVLCDEGIKAKIQEYKDFGVSKVSAKLTDCVCKNCEFRIDGYCNLMSADNFDEEDRIEENRLVIEGLKVPDYFGCIHFEPKEDKFLSEIGE